jgi:hypothetical protein
MNDHKRFLVEPGIKIRLSISLGEDGEGRKENVWGYSIQNAARKRRPTRRGLTMVRCTDCGGARETTGIGRGASGRPVTRSGQVVITRHFAHRMRLKHTPTAATYAKVSMGKQATMKRRCFYHRFCDNRDSVAEVEVGAELDYEMIVIRAARDTQMSDQDGREDRRFSETFRLSLSQYLSARRQIPARAHLDRNAELLLHNHGESGRRRISRHVLILLRRITVSKVALAFFIKTGNDRQMVILDVP